MATATKPRRPSTVYHGDGIWDMSKPMPRIVCVLGAEWPRNPTRYLMRDWIREDHVAVSQDLRKAQTYDDQGEAELAAIRVSEEAGVPFAVHRVRASACGLEG